MSGYSSTGLRDAFYVPPSGADNMSLDGLPAWATYGVALMRVYPGNTTRYTVLAGECCADKPAASSARAALVRRVMSGSHQAQRGHVLVGAWRIRDGVLESWLLYEEARVVRRFGW